MNICLLEGHLKLSKSHANVVSFDEKVSCLLASMILYELNEQFFFLMNKTAIELSGRTLAPFYNINLKLAGLCWSDNLNYCYKYNTLCQPCSSLKYRFIFQVWLIKSPARSNI